MQEHNFNFIWRVAGSAFLSIWVLFQQFMVLQTLLWADDSWAGLASYQDFCCSAANRSVEGRRSHGHLDGCLSGLSPLERQEMPSERPYPGQLWKHDSTRVIVVAVHLNTVTYELLSGGQSITESLGSFVAVFKRLRR